MKRSFVLFGLLCLCGALFASCRGPGGKKQVRIEDGVEIVSNPAVPQSRDFGRTLKLEERLRIRDEGGDFFFSSPWYPDIAADGSIFVEDNNNQLLKFSKDGRFLKNLVTPGQGPGEFTGFYRFALHGNEIYANDTSAAKIVRMDLEGRMREEVRPRGPSTLQDVTKTWFVFLLIMMPPPTERTGKLADMTYKMTWVSKDGGTLGGEHVFPVRMFVDRSVRLTWDKFLWAVDRERDLVYVSRTREYTIELLDLNAGRVVRSFKRDYPRVKYRMGENEAKIYQQYNPPPKEYESDILDLFVSGNLLWARTSTEDAQKGVLIDVFNESGDYLDNFYVPVKGPIMAVRGDILFVKETDEEGEITIVLYQKVE
jgi:6-bladed beta-propeller